MGMKARELSEKAVERRFLSGFFNGYIDYEGKQTAFGNTDLAIMEKAISAVEEKKDLLIINPFHYKLIPAFICAAYYFASEPKIPSKINDGLPMLLFPKKGYMGAIDNFQHSQVSSDTPIIERETIKSIDELKSDHSVYAIKEIGVLNEINWYNAGLAFVDLRKEIWRDNSPKINELRERNDIDSIIWYHSSKDYSTENVEEFIDEKVEIDNRWMFDQEPVIKQGTSTSSRKQEKIFENNIRVNFVSVNEENAVELFKQLYSTLKDVERRINDTLACTLLFNTLSNLVTSPDHYDRYAGENPYYSTIERLLKSVKSSSENLGGADGDLMYSFYKESQEIYDNLCENNPKRKALLEVVRRLDSDEEHTIVTKNQIDEKAARKMLYESDIELPEKLQIVKEKDLDPQPESNVIFTILPNRESIFYAFPPSNKVSFVCYPFQKDLIRKGYEEELMRSGFEDIQFKTANLGGVAETFEVDFDQLEQDISNRIISSSTNKTGQSSDNSDTKDYELTLKDGKRKFSSGKRVTVFPEDENKVERKRVSNLNRGEKLVLLDGAAEDLFEKIKSQRHEEEEIRKKEKVIEKWRKILQEGIETKYSEEELFEEMRSKGSSLGTSQPIYFWRTGHTLGPQSEEDVRIVLEILRPEFVSLADDIYDNLQYIRLLHQKLGWDVRKLIEKKLNPLSDVDLPPEIGNIQNVLDEIDIVEVKDVRKLDK